MNKMIILLTLVCSFAAFGNDKDQTLEIIATTQNGQTCIADILPPADDNCKHANGNRGACDGFKDCVCSKPDKHIEWKSAAIKNYTVYFYEDSSPFNDNCKLDSNNDGKLKCRIKGDASGTYQYGVKVAGCADYDPRIIIN
jgi:hypothetical protein